MSAPRSVFASSMLLRSLVYAVLAICVWTTLAFVVDFDSETLSLFVASACVCCALAILAFAFSTLCRKRGYSVLLEFWGSILCRTGVPACCALIALNICEESARRSYAFALLLAYFTTAPFHLILTFPPEKDKNASLVSSLEKDVTTVD